MVTPTNHVIAGPDLHRAGLWHFGDFRKFFLPNIGEEKKKVSPSERADPAPRGAYRGRAPCCIFSSRFSFCCNVPSLFHNRVCYYVTICHKPHQRSVILSDSQVCYKLSISAAMVNCFILFFSG